MICADDEAGRRWALAKIPPMQRADFEALFEIMAGLPVTIRLLDPPLHEFLPHEEKEATAVAKELGVAVAKLQARVADLHEFNPMLGFRGCRLAIRYPEITEMQARAIFEAAVSATKKTGKPVVPEVMIPLIAYRKEFDILRAVIVETAQAVEKETGAKLAYQIGTMIELPRARSRPTRRPRRGRRRVLPVRHQRPDADALGLYDDARRSRQLHAARGFEVDPLCPSTGWRRRVGAWAPSAGARSALISRSGSAASTAAIRPRSASATRRASTTSPARPSACRWRALPQRRQRSRPRARTHRAEPFAKPSSATEAGRSYRYDLGRSAIYRFGSPAW
jgi:pyruvate,orthophosphate dikinase